MRNRELWKPTKFVRSGGILKASRNPKHVSIASRFIGDSIAPLYERAVRAHARGRLLDMGCGHVPLYDVYRGLVTENVCIDWENTFHVNPYLDYTVDLTRTLPFEDAAFDTVLLTDVLEHIPEPLKVMREIARVLRTSGKLILTVPFFYWVHEEPHDYFRYTKYALRNFCQHSGLNVLELEPYGGLPEVFFDLTAKTLEFVPRPIPSIVRPFHVMASRICRTRLGRRVSRGTNGSFPLGYILIAEKPAAQEIPGSATGRLRESTGR